MNAVTFVSSDETTLSLPLAYVVGRHAQITYDINGEGVADMVGGALCPNTNCRSTRRAPAACAAGTRRINHISRLLGKTHYSTVLSRSPHIALTERIPNTKPRPMEPPGRCSGYSWP